MTEDLINVNFVRALIGESPSGPNTGYTGDLLDWPELFNYVCRFDRDPFDREATGGVPYPCDGSVCRDLINNDWEVQPGEIRDDDGNILSGTYLRGTAGNMQSLSCNSENGTLTCIDQDGLPRIDFDCELPDGHWEREWRDPDGVQSQQDYTYGQPRGMWDSESIDGEWDSGFGSPESLQKNVNGIGWRTPYVPKPIDNHQLPDPSAPEDYYRDAFERPLHFFKLDGQSAFMILSGGDSGTFYYDYIKKFPDYSAQQFEYPQREFDYGSLLDPDDRIAKRIDLTQEYLERMQEDFLFPAYDQIADGALELVSASGSGNYENRDNIVRVIDREEWDRGFFTVHNLWIDNLHYDSATNTLDDVRCRLYGVLDAAGDAYDLRNPVDKVELFCGERGSQEDPVNKPNEYNCDPLSSNGTGGDGLLYLDNDGKYTWMVGNRIDLTDTTNSTYVNDDTAYAFRYTTNSTRNTPSVGTIVTGARYMVCTFDDQVVGERSWEKIIPVFGHPARKAEIRNLYLDKEHFRPLP